MSPMSLNVPAHLFTAIDHVGIAVPDLDAAIAFYEQTYGMRLAHQETNEEQGVREAMMAVGDSGSCIQLLAPLQRGAPRSPSSSTAPGPGIQQMAYRVTDVDAVSAVLRERGSAPAVRRAAARHVGLRGSTSSTPRTPAASWWSWWSPPATEEHVTPTVARGYRSVMSPQHPSRP